MPPLGLFVIALAAVTLGVARAAIDALIELAGAKQPMGFAARLRDRLEHFSIRLIRSPGG